MISEYAQWWLNQYDTFEEVAEILKKCGNLNPDKRDFCKSNHCPMYEIFCIEFDPLYDSLDGSEKE